MEKIAFEAPFWGLGATYAVYLRCIGKPVGDFLLVIIELFSLGAFVLSESTRLTDRRTDRYGQMSIARSCVCVRSCTVKTSEKIHCSNNVTRAECECIQYTTWMLARVSSTMTERASSCICLEAMSLNSLYVSSCVCR